jgi:hypothetical protein
MDTDNEHKLKRRIERSLGRSVSSAAWGLAETEGYVGEAIAPDTRSAGEQSLADFLARLLTVSDAAVRAAPTRHRTVLLSNHGLQARIEAISRLAGEHAAGDAEVLRFRRDVLHRAAPMSPRDASAYLDDEVTRTRSTASDPGHLEVLRYQNREVDYSIHVTAGSPLDQLRTLALDLTRSYPWEPAQAAAFVLEGLMPLATPFTLHLPHHFHEGRPLRSRIVMEVDMWMPAAIVLKAYREAQRQVLPGHNRPVSQRSVDLVNFVQRLGPATWQKRLDAWNTEHPSQPFPDYRTLRTAYERAASSLLTPRYRPAVQQRQKLSRQRRPGRRGPCRPSAYAGSVSVVTRSQQ